jgi:hypothetical protein
MDTTTTNLAKELKNMTSRLFITRYSELFNKQLASLNDSSKHIIRKNKQLNELYDLFLDFIIDSSQHLDYTTAKEQEENMEPY